MRACSPNAPMQDIVDMEIRMLYDCHSYYNVIVTIISTINCQISASNDIAYTSNRFWRALLQLQLSVCACVFKNAPLIT
jgi:hypothetical protein